MQDQGKRLLFAVALALGVMLVWQTLFPSKKPDEPPKQTTTAGSNMPPVSAPAHTQVGISTETPSAPVTAAPAGPAKKITLTYPNLTATFSSRGGVLESWHLSDPRYLHDANKGELLPKQPDTGELGVNFANSTYVLPPNADWTGTQVNDHEVMYKLSTPELEVTKTFELVPASFIVRMIVDVNVKVPAGKEAHETLAISSFGFQDPNDSGGGSSRVQARVWDSSTMRGGSIVSTALAGVREHARFEKDIEWTGFEHPYLLVAFAPKPLGPLGSGVEKHTYAEATPGLMRTDMLYPTMNFQPGTPAFRSEIVGYLGPKNYDSLSNADDAAGYTTGFNKVIDFGWFSPISRGLLWLLLKFHDVFGNWGISIVLLTLLVKAATLYWTTKSMRSMKAMAVLAPQMKILQAKYKDDKQRLQIETMALYKQHGANPLSGCLPMLLQMPIWLALYRMLSSAGELYQQPFIPGWVNDLTLADPYYVLPVVLVVTMFAQARLTPQSPDPSQRTQQRIMQYGMPLMFGAMSFFFPAGLTLYIFTNTCLSALHSIYMNKFDKKSLELVAKMKAAQDPKTSAVVKDAKDANPKSKDEEDEDADVDAVLAGKASPRVAVRQRPKKKKGRR